jgi:hypothetical protein
MIDAPERVILSPHGTYSDLGAPDDRRRARRPLRTLGVSAWASRRRLNISRCGCSFRTTSDNDEKTGDEDSFEQRTVRMDQSRAPRTRSSMPGINVNERS